MKLSICIPIYQQKIKRLVSQLLFLLQKEDLDFEICLIDDDSNETIQSENRKLKDLDPRVQYIENEKNIGRSKIRNKLASLSTGDYIIFLDCDVSISNQDFIKNYVSCMHSGDLLVCGGYSYGEELNQRGYELRYHYGKGIEEYPTSGMIDGPFLGGNFLVHRSVLNQVQFDESIEKYGFEDLLFSLQFEEHFEKDTSFILNPVDISSIDKTEDYLQKTMEAMDNLAMLYQNEKVLLQDNVRLLIAYHQLKNNGLLFPLLKIAQSSLPMVLFNLSSKQPNLRLFQLFKLIHFSKAMRQNYDSRSH